MPKEKPQEPIEIAAFVLSPRQRDLLLVYLADRESQVAKDLNAMVISLPGVAKEKKEPKLKAVPKKATA